jgi:hypothetical protein
MQQTVQTPGVLGSTSREPLSDQVMISRRLMDCLCSTAVLDVTNKQWLL